MPLSLQEPGLYQLERELGQRAHVAAVTAPERGVVAAGRQRRRRGRQRRQRYLPAVDAGLCGQRDRERRVGHVGRGVAAARQHLKRDGVTREVLQFHQRIAGAQGAECGIYRQRGDTCGAGAGESDDDVFTEQQFVTGGQRGVVRLDGQRGHTGSEVSRQRYLDRPAAAIARKDAKGQGEVLPFADGVRGRLRRDTAEVV